MQLLDLIQIWFTELRWIKVCERVMWTPALFSPNLTALIFAMHYKQPEWCWQSSAFSALDWSVSYTTLLKQHEQRLIGDKQGPRDLAVESESCPTGARVQIPIHYPLTYILCSRTSSSVHFKRRGKQCFSFVEWFGCMLARCPGNDSHLSKSLLKVILLGNKQYQCTTAVQQCASHNAWLREKKNII